MLQLHSFDSGYSLIVLEEGGGATGCGIDTKVELRKISEQYHFLIDQWHYINSLEIYMEYNI